MSDISIYQFDDPVDFVAVALERKRLVNSSFSLRAWSRQLGYANPSLLGQVLTRKRRLKVGLAKKLGSNLRMASSDRRYFETLVLYHAAKTSEERAVCESALDRLRQKQGAPSLELTHDKFHAIAQWIHWALLEGIDLKGFDGSIDFLNRVLDHRLPKMELVKAVRRMIRLGVLKQDQRGRLTRGHDVSILLEGGVPDEAVRAFHLETMRRARDAAETKSLAERDLRTSTVAIERKDLPKLKEILRRAHEEIVALSAPGKADSVYQVQTCAFRISKEDIQ